MDKRKVIGILVGGIADDFTVQTCRGAMRAAREKNVDVFRENILREICGRARISCMSISIIQFFPMRETDGLTRFL